MAEHVLQFNDGGADWCIHCGTFSIYCNDDDECEGPRTGRFDTVYNAENYLRVYCDTFGADGLTDEGRVAYVKAQADFEAEKAASRAVLEAAR